MTLHVREWGQGPPVIALHPLGLESSGFEGVGRALVHRGLRTLALDLPGFGKTPASDQPPRPDVLAQPVIELASRLDPAPVILGISLGGRVALECALTAPSAFRGVIAIAPALPWLRFRWLLTGAGLLDERAVGWLPLEHAWPLLRWLSGVLRAAPWLRDDELAQAGAQLVYNLACPATRASFIAAAREIALDPAFGARGLWPRLATLRVPGAFVWGEQDQLISLRFAHHVAGACPQAQQIVLPCLGHWLNGPHHRCLAESLADLIDVLATTGDFASDDLAQTSTIGAARPAVKRCTLPGREQDRARTATRPAAIARSFHAD